MITVDLGKTMDLLDVAERQIGNLHGVQIGGHTDRRQAADVTKSLLRLSDLLALAATEVRTAYWDARGNPLMEE